MKPRFDIIRYIVSLTFKQRLLPPMTVYRILPALLACLIVSACGSLVYKQDIQQGNVLDSKDVSRLEPGMTKRQVKVLLGTPSISSPFHEERWDYMNTLAKRGGKTRKRILTLYFDDDALQSIEGSYLDEDRKSTRLNSSHVAISYAVFCLKNKTER